MNKSSSRTQNNQEAPAPIRVESLPRALWLGSCARYTVLCLGFLLLSAIVSDSLTTTYVDTVSFFLLLPFAFFLTLAARVRHADKLSVGGKCALHPLLTLGGFYLCCYLPFQIRTKPAGQQILMILLLAALAYGVVMAVVCLVSAKRSGRQSADTPYVSQYGKK